MIVSLILFISIICIILSNELVLILIYLDLLVLCIASFSTFLSIFYLANIYYIFSILLLAIAAVETAIGLSLIVTFYQTTEHRGLENLHSLYF